MYCSVDIASIAAMVSVHNIWITPSSSKDRPLLEEAQRKFAVEEGDHLTYLNGKT